MVDIKGIRNGQGRGPYDDLTIETTGGKIGARLYQSTGAMSAAIFLGGATSEWDSPVHGRLYPDLCVDLREWGVSALRIRFRKPGDLAACTEYALAGIAVLIDMGIGRIALVGHAFGAAAALQAAARSASVVAVATLAAPSVGSEAVSRLAPHTSVLCLHGDDDQVLPSRNSEDVYQLARGSKELHLLERVGHSLDEGGERVHQLMRDFLLRHLAGAEVGWKSLPKTSVL